MTAKFKFIKCNNTYIGLIFDTYVPLMFILQIILLYNELNYI